MCIRDSLDTLFTTVFEPYQGERYIESMEQVAVTRADGMPVNINGDMAKAVRVSLTNGRVDYIVYATNNTVEYVVGDQIFNFIGFVGVYTEQDLSLIHICNSAHSSSEFCNNQ